MKSREVLKEFRDLGAEQINEKLRTSEEELMKLRFRLASGQLEQTSQIRTLRRTVARLRTVLEEKARSQQTGL